MSDLTSRIFRRFRHDGDDAAKGNPLHQGLIGYTDDVRGWDPELRRLSSPIDEATAASRHLGHRALSCVLRSSGRLVVVTTHTSGEIKVSRFDATDSYAAEVREFRPVDDRLWLRSIKVANGNERTMAAADLVTDWFTWVRPDTTATWTRFDRTSPQGRAQELRLDWDPTGNWFELPACGDYDHLVEPTDLVARLWPQANNLPLAAS